MDSRSARTITGSERQPRSATDFVTTHAATYSGRDGAYAMSMLPPPHPRALSANFFDQPVRQREARKPDGVSGIVRCYLHEIQTITCDEREGKIPFENARDHLDSELPRHESRGHQTLQARKSQRMPCSPRARGSDRRVLQREVRYSVPNTSPTVKDGSWRVGITHSGGQKVVPRERRQIAAIQVSVVADSASRSAKRAAPLEIALSPAGDESSARHKDYKNERNPTGRMAFAVARFPSTLWVFRRSRSAATGANSVSTCDEHDWGH